VPLVRFEWNEYKNRLNRKKHGIWFEEATQVFGDPHNRFFLDNAHSDHEERYVVVGHTCEGRLLVVIHCYRKSNEVIRIISARKATKKERKFYEKGI
jgi:uncharacterized protein